MKLVDTQLLTRFVLVIGCFLNVSGVIAIMVQLKLLNAYFRLWKINWQTRFRKGWLQLAFLLGDPEFMMTADDKRFSKMYQAMTPAEQDRLDKAKGDGYWAITKQMEDKYKI